MKEVLEYAIQKLDNAFMKLKNGANSATDELDIRQGVAISLFIKYGEKG